MYNLDVICGSRLWIIYKVVNIYSQTIDKTGIWMYNPVHIKEYELTGGYIK